MRPFVIWRTAPGVNVALFNASVKAHRSEPIG